MFIARLREGLHQKIVQLYWSHQMGPVSIQGRAPVPVYTRCCSLMNRFEMYNSSWGCFYLYHLDPLDCLFTECLHAISHFDETLQRVSCFIYRCTDCKTSSAAYLFVFLLTVLLFLECLFPKMEKCATGAQSQIRITNARNCKYTKVLMFRLRVFHNHSCNRLDMISAAHLQKTVNLFFRLILMPR